MRKYITIPFEEYTRIKNNKVEEKDLTTSGRNAAGSTDVTSHHSGEVNGHHDLSVDSSSSEWTAASHRLPQSAHPHRTDSSDPVPPHLDNHDISPPPDYSSPQVYAQPPTSPTDDTSHFEQNTPVSPPKDPAYLPSRSPAVLSRGAGSKKNSLKKNAPGKKKKNHKILPSSHFDSDQDHDSVSAWKEKSVSQEEGGRETSQGMKHNLDPSSVKERNVDRAHNYRGPKNSSPKEDLKYAEQESPKLDHSLREGCSSSSYSSPSDHSLHPVSIHHISSDQTQDLEEPFSPEVFVQDLKEGQNKTHILNNDDHHKNSQSQYPEQSSSSGQDQFDHSVLKDTPHEDWSGLWNVKNVSRVLSLKRKAEEQHHNMEGVNSTEEDHAESRLVGHAESHPNIDDRNQVAVVDREKLIPEPQHRTKLRTELERSEQMLRVESPRPPAPDQSSLPPPGVPAEKIQNKKKLQHEIGIQSATLEEEKEESHNIAQKILKQKPISNPVIQRHNTRPKRSKAGAPMESWKLGWTP